MSGLKTVRGQVDRVRRDGARSNGSQKVASMESSTLLSAVSEVFGLNYVLNILGLVEVISKSGVDISAEVVETVVAEKVVEDVAEKVETVVAEKVEEDVAEKVEAVVEARRSPRLSRKSSAL